MAGPARPGGDVCALPGAAGLVLQDQAQTEGFVASVSQLVGSAVVVFALVVLASGCRVDGGSSPELHRVRASWPQWRFSRSLYAR